MEQADYGSDTYFMQRALDEARQAARAGEIPVGAVVVAAGHIIARGHNLTETLCDVTAHAEMQALTAAASTLGGKYLQGCTLYVTVEPCIMCAGAIGWAQGGRHSRNKRQGALHPREGTKGRLLVLPLGVEQRKDLSAYRKALYGAPSECSGNSRLRQRGTH